MTALPKRVISALIALAVLFATYYFFKRNGLVVVGGLVFAGGAYEFSKIAFSKANFKSLKFLFLIYSILLLVMTMLSPPTLISFWGTAIAFFITSSLWTLRGRLENEQLLSTLALAVLGFVYCSLLPTFILKILFLEHGVAWFTLLIAVVFSGDTFAYFGGIWFGRSKLMPSLSPGKTIAGAIAGGIGSLIAGALVGHFMLSSFPLGAILFSSLLASVLAQNGDLFESLIKRVADVKDSGKIMPGHGGILDRLDGVYFAAPLIFGTAEALYL